MSKTIKCIIRQDWETRNASGALLDRQRRVYVTNEDGTPHIYDSIKEARAEIVGNYGRDANKFGTLHSRTVSEYSGDVHDSYISIVREGTEEYAEATEATKAAEQATAETTPYLIWEDQPETGSAPAEPVTLDKFTTETVDKYGEAFHLIDLIKDTTAYQHETKSGTIYTIGHSAEYGEWIAEIDNEYGFVAAGQGATPQTALESACIDAAAADAMRANPNPEDAVNVTAGEAFYTLNGHHPDTSDPEQHEQYARMLEMATEHVKRYGVFYGIVWEPYQVADADQDATAEPVRAYQRYELEAYLGEPADYDVNAIEAEATAYTSAGLQYWTADAETLAAIAEAYQIAQYMPA